jgi:CubicO group peptidase (beta-lactamase class C family)
MCALSAWIAVCVFLPFAHALAGENRQAHEPADARTSAALQRLEEITQEEMRRWKVPGVAIGVVKGNEVIYTQGFGSRDVFKNLPVTPHTNFSLASMTKAFTAMAHGLLIEDGTIQWDTPIKTRVPDFCLCDPSLEGKVTLRDILSHRTGLADKDSLWTSGEYRAEGVFSHLQELEISAPLGARHEYNNIMYIAAGVLVEKLSGIPWNVLLKDRLFKPLHMTHSGCSVEELLATKEYSYSYSYSPSEDGYDRNEFPGPEHNSWYYPRASGSVFSNVRDMGAWMVFQLNAGKYKGRQIVAAEIVREMHRPQVKLASPPFYLDYPEVTDHAYGLGWFVDRYRGFRRVHHGGTSLGYSNYIVLLPDERIGVVILSNRAVLLPVELSYYAADLLLGLEVRDWKGRFNPKE